MANLPIYLNFLLFLVSQNQMLRQMTEANGKIYWVPNDCVGVWSLL